MKVKTETACFAHHLNEKYDTWWRKY